MVLGWPNSGKKCGLGEPICGPYLSCSIPPIGRICPKLSGGLRGHPFVPYPSCGMRFTGHPPGGGPGGGIARLEQNSL